jgi:hypothetical protein
MVIGAVDRDATSCDNRFSIGATSANKLINACEDFQVATQRACDVMARSLDSAIRLSALPVSTWDTDLWVRSNRAFASKRINYLQGRLNRAKGALARSRIELQMLRLEDAVRREGEAND